MQNQHGGDILDTNSSLPEAALLCWRGCVMCDLTPLIRTWMSEWMMLAAVIKDLKGLGE